MKLRKALTSAVVGCGMLHAASASALLFDQNVTPEVIFGSGNTNGSFTVDRANGVELGLRGKLRHNAAGAPENTFNSNSDGTYSFNAGVAPTQAAPTAEWSFEWSINSDYDDTSGYFLSSLNYVLGLDSDPTAGTSFVTFDPINGGGCGGGAAVSWDHAIGNNSTGNGGGTKFGGAPVCDTASYATAIGANNVAQNSWKPHWFLASSGFDPTVDGTYDFYLQANDSAGAQVARTSMQIIVGDGAAQVPVPATLLLFGAGLLGLGYSRRKA